MAAGNSPSIVGFDPRNVPGMALWLDAADASTLTFSSGSNVSVWRDKSGNGYVSSNLVGTSTLAQTSLNGFASVYTPLSNIMGINNFTWRTKFVAFIVGKSSVGRYLLGHLTSLFIYTGNNDLMAIPGTGGTYFGVQDSVLSTGVSITGSNNPFMLAIGYDNATSSNANPYTLNGTTRGTRVPGTSSIVSDQNVTKTFYINSTNGTGGNTYDNVNTGEILIYNDTLSTSQRQTIEGYLAHKWGLNTALVGGLAKPTQIPGCALWLDAADASTMTFSSGSNVSVWRDKSGTGNNFTPTAGTPSNILDGTKSVISIPSGTIMSSISNITFSSNSAFFVVSKLLGVGPTTIGYLLGFTGTGPQTNGDYAIRIGGSGLNGTAAAAGNTNDLAPGNYYVNGNFNPNYAASVYSNAYTIIDTTAPILSWATTATSPITFSTAFLSRFYIGNIAEFIFYPSGVTSTQRQSVEGYLATKWGLRASLPATHPSYTGIAAQPFALVRPFTRVFQPVDIPGLALWLDAADGSSFTFSSGSNVSVWRDKSGNGNNTSSIVGTPQLASSSINGQNSMYFNGSSVFFGPASNTTSTLTVFSVVIGNTGTSGAARALSVGASGQLDYNSAPYANLLSYTTPPTICFYRNSASVTYNLTYGVPFLHCDKFDGTNGTLYINGISQGSAASTGSFGYSTYGIGGSTGTPSNYWIGNIGEVIFYNGALTDSQRQTIEGYLAWKWGLNSQLPGVPLNPLWQSGLALWLDAADQSTLALSGSNVSVWRDKSGNARNAGASGFSGVSLPTVGTLNGLPSVRFSASTNTLLKTSISTLTSGIENYFIVLRLTANTTIGTRILMDNTSTRQFLTSGALPNTLFMYSGNFPASKSLTVSANVPFLAECIVGSGRQLVYVNGIANSSSQVANAAAITTLYWGGNNEGSPADAMDGDYGEILVFNSILTTSQRQGVEGYLAAKWGLTVPTSTPHPFFRLPASSVLNEIPPPFTIGNADFSTDYSTAVSSAGKTFYRFVTTGKTMTLTLASGTLSIDIYLIAGGGGGGAQAAGGGGAGGLVQYAGYILSAGTYNIQIGVGGVGGVTSPSVTYGRRGGNTTFASFTATGGGGGGGYQSGGAPENSGGCGAGAGYEAQPGTGSQGGSGGAYAFPNSTGGGGVASGAAGTGGANNGNIGGNGGQGIAINFAGTRILLGGGGGGGGFTTTAGTGTFGGGNGSGSDRPVATNGSDGTGGGGGGAGWSGVGGGGRGGSGVFIIVA